MPVAFDGRVRPRPDILDGPDFAYDMQPLRVGEPSSAEVRLVTTDKELLGYAPGDNQARMAYHLNLRRQISAFRPEAGSWARLRAARSDLLAWGDRPATTISYRWLWEDLQALHLVQTAAPLGGGD
jgi:hypothetical protein